MFRFCKIKLSVDYFLLMTEKELMLLRTHGFRNSNRNAGAPMSFPLSIVIWDYNPERIAEIDRNLHLALRELNLRGTVSSLSEPPLMSREGLVGREPVLEIGDAYWSLRPGETISKEACLKLLSRIVQEKG